MRSAENSRGITSAHKVGSLFENLVVVEAMKAMTHRGQRPDLYFYRDNHQQEVDLVLNREGNQIGIEIKSAATLQTSFIKSLNRLDEKVLPLDEKHLVYSAKKSVVNPAAFQQSI